MPPRYLAPPTAAAGAAAAAGAGSSSSAAAAAAAAGDTLQQGQQQAAVRWFDLRQGYDEEGQPRVFAPRHAQQGGGGGGWRAAEYLGALAGEREGFGGLSAAPVGTASRVKLQTVSAGATQSAAFVPP